MLLRRLSIIVLSSILVLVLLIRFTLIACDDLNKFAAPSSTFTDKTASARQQQVVVASPESRPAPLTSENSKEVEVTITTKENSDDGKAIESSSITKAELTIGLASNSSSPLSDPSSPNHESTAIFKEFGLVLCDVRVDGSVGNLVLPWLRQARMSTSTNSSSASLSPLPIELWIGHNASMNDELNAFTSNEANGVTVRRLPLASSEFYSGLDFHIDSGTHIAKAYAIRQSSFGFPIFFDSDVYMCPGWLTKVKEIITKSTNASQAAAEATTMGMPHIIWTYAPAPFGATKGMPGAYVSKAEIDPVREEFEAFPERNTGTILAVRRSDSTSRSITEQWLDDVMRLFILQNRISLKNKHRGYSDQWAFREATFLHRPSLIEHVMRGDARPNGWARRQRVKGCKCGRQGLLYHSKHCSHKYTEAGE